MSLQFATKVAKSFDCLKYLSEIEVNSIFKLQTVYMTFIVHHFLLTGRGSKEAKEEESQAEVGVSFVRHLVLTSLNVTIPLGWKPNKSGRQRATCNPPSPLLWVPGKPISAVHIHMSCSIQCKDQDPCSRHLV